ncbi:hypothetical protein FNU76_05800 [Chitinimonas arctica]|uniref:DUF2244 domain-containing protein n=1 Tax=Chitinimonas arctica TaxID=2594795 RepID=A0A516SCM3_9NEIS|nr:hypothetical protein [Chitinimonas arctica]QDQ25903.1 hypothetical protein FNU76_05800 [Chitinimonas arctica]
MNQSTKQASLAELARWLRVEEGDGRDRLELASAWQRLPDGAPDRLTAKLGAGMAVGIIVLLSLQAVLTRSGVVLAIALAALVLALMVAWRLRGWFWLTQVEVDDARVCFGFRGVGVPPTTALALDDIVSLDYRLADGKLVSLALAHRQGKLVLPYTGQPELDKLYSNLLKHLLQKRRPAIGFGKESEQQ